MLRDFAGIRRLLRRTARSRADAAHEMRDELDAHLTLRIDALMQQGLPRERAESEARARFGDFDAAQRDLVASAQARQSALHRQEHVENIVADARYAVRRLARHPGYTVVYVATIALAIALASSVFAIVDGVMLKPLPYPRAAELVALQGIDSSGGPVVVVSADNWFDWRAQSRTLLASAIYQNVRVSMFARSQARTRAAVVAHPDLFAVLQMGMVWGRHYTEDDAARQSTIVVSELLWPQIADGAPRAGVSVTVDGRAREVIGVVKNEQRFPAGVDMWLPYRHVQIGGGARNNVNWFAIGRLAPGATVTQAAADLSVIARRIRQETPGTLYSHGVAVLSLRDQTLGDTSSFLRLLMIAVTVVLLLACTNLAAANIARGTARVHEHALRAALGASRRRLVSQLLVEHGLVAAAGAAVGTVLTWALVRGLPLSGIDLPRLNTVRVDARVIAFGIAMSAIAALLTGVAPVLQGARTSPAQTLAGAGRGTARGGRGLPGAWLVGIEVAMAVVLVACAGLLVQSMRTLLARPLGFTHEAVSTAEVMLTTSGYRTAAARMRFLDDFTASLRSDPNVAHAALASSPPLSSGGMTFVELIDRTPQNEGAGYRAVGEDYFTTLGIPLLMGRALLQRDDTAQMRVVVVNQEMVRRFWPTQNPIGRLVRAPSMEGWMFKGNAPWLTVVGVVGDIRHYGYAGDVLPEMYVSYRQLPAITYGLTAVIRGRDGRDISLAVGDRVARLDPLVALDVKRLSDAVRESTSTRAFTMWLLGVFGIVALLLASLGVYAMLALAVARRQREMAVRGALGALRSRLVWLVMRSAGTVVVAGLGAGVALAAALADTIRATLFEVEPLDVGVLAVVVVTIGVVGCLAALIPALRVTKISPAQALLGD